MKKIICLLLSVLMSMALLSACNSRSNKIVIWAYDTYAVAAEEAVKLYKQDHKDVEFDIIELSQDDLVEKFRIALGSGNKANLPDIIFEEDYNAIGYFKYYEDCFVDISDYINADDFVEYKINNVTYHGKIYGIPYDSNATPLFYRIDLIKQAGYSEADMDDLTWEEFIEIGKTVKQKTGVSMITICPEGNIEGRVIFQSSGRWYYDMQGNLDISNNKGLTHMMLTMKELYDANIAYRAASWDDIISSIYNGKTASVTGGVFWGPIIAANPDQFNLWRVAKIPKMSGDESFSHYSMCGGGAVYALNTAKKDKTIDFICNTFGKSTELANIMIEKTQIVPVLKSAFHVPNAQKGDAYFGGQNICEVIAEWGVHTNPVFYGEFPYEITYKHGELMADYLSGSKTLDQVISELQEYAENLQATA